MKDLLKAYFAETSRLFSALEISDFTGKVIGTSDGSNGVLRLLRQTKDAAKKVMIVGNGGSAAIASHLQNDLCKASRVPAIVFTEQPLLTALANDDGYQTAYESLVRIWATPNDLLVAISSSGQSENILRATRAAREKGCTIITLSGFDSDNPLRSLGDINFYVPSYEYGFVEIIHAVLCQFFTDGMNSFQEDD